MPASLMYEMEHSSGNALEDQRALQLALELSMLGLNNDHDSIQSANGFEGDPRNKKSQNTTECVPVPSSEHVAEIVGRQGCKIKALRAKTNTYIKTPVRGEEPVFVVTGRKEDVSAAKREILSAAEHFSQIRAQRKSNLNGSVGGPAPNSNVPGQTTIQVRVPYRVVGLVVGPKGATIKRIQQQTNTYIITPSRDKEPVFEVTGLPDNVETARKEIEAHIAMRTGGLIDSTANGSDESGSDFSNSPLLNGIENPFTTSSNTSNGFNTLYKGSSDAFSAFSNSRDSNLLMTRSTTDIFNFVNGSNKMSDIYSSFSSNGFSKCFGSYDTDEGIGESPTFDSVGLNSTIQSSVWPDFSSTQRPFSSTISPLERRSSSLGSPTATSTTTTTTADATSSSVDSLLLEQHAPARRLCSDPLSTAFTASVTTTTASTLGSFPTSSESTSITSSNSPTESLGSIGGSIAGSVGGSIGGTIGRKLKRDCIVCFEGDIVAALVPCGHNMFCMECATRVCGKAEPECPVCHQTVSQAIRIFS